MATAAQHTTLGRPHSTYQADQYNDSIWQLLVTVNELDNPMSRSQYIFIWLYSWTKKESLITQLVAWRSKQVHVVFYEDIFHQWSLNHEEQERQESHIEYE